MTNLFERTVYAVAASLVAIACSQPLEFADWTIPVPEGTRIIEYVHVPLEERTEWIELEARLTVGSDADTADGSFYRPFAIATDEAGRVYVADAGEHKVKIFDSAGNHVLSIGREGQGPGEFRGPTLVTIAGSAIVVGDETKLSLWTVEGEHIDDVATRALGMSYLGGLNDGSIVVGYQTIDTATRQATSNFVGWNQSAQEVAFYAALGEPEFRFYPDASSERRASVSAGMTSPSVASSRDGEVYVTQSDEYQVLALDAESKPRWALRVAMSRPPLYRLEIERTLESVRRRFPEATESAIDWPGTSYALSRIWLDGHGHLYVFPYAPPQLEAQERQVDVYSRDGTRLFAGRMTLPAGAWTNMWAAYGDFVYYLGPDEETSEWGVVRYRLVEPFE